MSLFGDNPAGGDTDAVRVPHKKSPQRFEYEVVWVDPHTFNPSSKKSPTSVMNAYAEQGWRVVAVVQNIDNNSRGRHLIVTFERLVG